MTSEEQRILGDIAGKILMGLMLTEEEFELAKKDGMYDSRLPWKYFMMSHYQDDIRIGYIYTNHEEFLRIQKYNQTHKDKKFIGFGIPVTNLKRGFLSIEQIEWLHELGWNDEEIGMNARREATA
jgi:hypothetical protein